MSLSQRGKIGGLEINWVRDLAPDAKICGDSRIEDFRQQLRRLREILNSSWRSAVDGWTLNKSILITAVEHTTTTVRTK